MLPIIILIDEAKTSIDCRDVEGINQVPLGRTEVVRETAQQKAVRDIVEVKISATETLVAWLQQLFVLIDHAQPEIPLHGDDELGLQHCTTA